MKLAIFIFAAHLLGSIPFGFLIAKAYGKDLRNIGSGNIGATNLSRALGKKWGYFCFLLDVLKGLLPMLAAKKWCLSDVPTSLELFGWLAVGLAAILGHIFPVYLKFKGGKGVATSFGVAMGLWPYYTYCAGGSFIIWLIAVLIWRYISLASIIASVAFPVFLVTAIALNNNWSFAGLWPLLTAAALIPILVIIRHRQNIKRILAGNESKVLRKQ